MNIPIPIVKITMDHMRIQMLHAFSDYTGQLEKQFEQALDKAIAEFDFKAEADRMIREHVNDLIKRQVRDELMVMAGQKVKAILEKIDLEKGPK